MLNADRIGRKPSSRRRRWSRWILAGALGLITIVALFLVLRGEPEPTYRGVKLRRWFTTNSFAEIDKALAEIGPESIPCLIRILEENDSPFTKLKIALWRRLPLSYKQKYLAHRPCSVEEIRPKAAYGLALWGPEAIDALPALIRCSADRTSPSTQGYVLQALANLSNDSPEARLALSRALQDKDPARRSMAANAVWNAELQYKALLPPLLEPLKAYQPNVPPKPVQEILALTHFGSEAREAVPFLTRALTDPQMRFHSLMALKSIGPDAKAAVPAIVELLQLKNEQLQNLDWNRSYHASAIEVLASIGPAAEGALPALTNALQSESFVVRSLAAFAIGKIQDQVEDAVPVLVANLKRRWPDGAAYWTVHFGHATMGLTSHQTAAWLLAEIGPPAKAALPALTAALKGREFWTRVGAARAIWRIDSDKEIVLPVFIEALKSQYESERLLAIGLLAEMGTEARPAVPLLLEARKTSLSARRQVHEALKKIEPEIAARLYQK